MSKRSIMHMLTPMSHNSPFDINMAIDAGYDLAFTYDNIQLKQVADMTQDAIFSRGPSGVKKTGIFIGGRDIGLAMDMLEATKNAMVPPFEVSVFADPSGAFTTAAALVACVERELKNNFQQSLEGKKAVVFGGTGPVGLAAAVIAAEQGVITTIVDHFSLDIAHEYANEAKRRYGVDLIATTAASEADKARLITDTDIIFCTVKAGIQVLNASVLADAKQLKVAGDVNAVPPLGIEGIKLMDAGAPLIHAVNSPGAVGVGSLAIGDVKYHVQHALLQQTLDHGDPVYLDFRSAFESARKLA